MALLSYDRGFESGTILTTDSPAGTWTDIQEHRSSQHAVVTPDGLSGRPPTHPGFTKAAYTEVTTGDEWGTTGFYRCLISDPGQNISGQRPKVGDEAWFAFAFYIPLNSMPNGPLLWEIHNISGLGAIAPFAVSVGPMGPGKNWRIVGNSYVSDDANSTRRVIFRQATGECANATPGGFTGTPSSQWQSITIPGLDLTTVYDTWVNIIVHIPFKEDTTGYYELWAVVGNNPTSSDFVEAAPTLKKTGIPTCQWDAETNTHDAMYLQTGLYTGTTNPTSINKVYHSGTQVCSSFSAAVTTLTSGAAGSDTTAPLLTDLRVANSSTITLSYDEALDSGSVPSTGDFAVTATAAGTVSVSSVSISGAIVSLTYTTGAIVNTDAVTVVYTPGTNKIRDAAHNNCAAINQTAINQLSPVGLVFGKTTPGDTTLGNLNNYKRCSPFSLSQDAQVSAIGHFVRGGLTSSDTATIRLVIYSDSSGSPGTLVASAPEYTLAGDAAPGWREVSLSSPVSLTAGTYWLGEHFTGHTNAYATDVTVVSGAEALRADIYSDGTSSSWSASEGGGFTGTYDKQLSIYARLQSVSSTPFGRVHGNRVHGTRVNGTRV